QIREFYFLLIFVIKIEHLLPPDGSPQVNFPVGKNGVFSNQRKRVGSKGGIVQEGSQIAYGLFVSEAEFLFQLCEKFRRRGGQILRKKSTRPGQKTKQKKNAGDFHKLDYH